MKYLLDTNICVYLLRRISPGVRERFEAHPIEDVGVSAITVVELQYGVSKSRSPAENQEALTEFLVPLTVLPFDGSEASAFGAIRATLERQGQPLGPYDLLIAAQALTHGLTLVTNNTREFARVPDLAVDDWTRT